MIAPSSQPCNVPDNIVVLDDDDAMSVGAMTTRPVNSDSTTKQAINTNSFNGQLYLWYQIGAHMRRERMVAEQIHSASGGGAGGPPNNNLDPMNRFQAEVLRRQYLMYAHFYHSRCKNNVTGVNPASRVIRKPSSSGGAAERLQYGYLHGNGGGATARASQPFMVAPPTGPRVLNLGQTGGVGSSGDSEPEGIDLTLKL